MSTRGCFAFLVLVLLAACAGAQVARERASYTIETFTVLDFWRDDSRHWNLFACADHGGSDCRWLGTLWNGHTVQTSSTSGYRRFVIAPERRATNTECQPPFDGTVLHDSPGRRSVDLNEENIQYSLGWSVEYIGDVGTERCDGSSRLRLRGPAEFHPPSFIHMTRTPSARAGSANDPPPRAVAVSMRVVPAGLMPLGEWLRINEMGNAPASSDSHSGERAQESAPTDFPRPLGEMMLRGRSLTREESSQLDAWSISPARTGTPEPLTIYPNGQAQYGGTTVPPCSSDRTNDAGLCYEIHTVPSSTR